MKLKRGLLSLALMLCLLTTACDLGGAGQAAETITTYVGKTADSAAFVAITVKGSDVWGYICDGKSLGQWFDGSASGSAINISAASGAQLASQVASNAVQGTINAAGSTFRFTADVATGSAGFFRAAKIVDNVKVIAGLIVLSNGEFRGLVTGGSAPVPITGPLPATNSDTVQLDSIGNMGGFTLTKAIPGSDVNDPVAPTPTAAAFMAVRREV